MLADSAAAIGGLVNQRLSFMKDVAGYKAQRKRKGSAVLTVNEK
ncbi:chorismate mutase [Serratia symbiotica]|uniref:Chorismate mutase n=1 Tax=Serratia symbiotica TaxID=138074 RepID=A0A455VFS0_9GAMM|nr:chorismate mutase [Serratia symbiotica]